MDPLRGEKPKWIFHNLGNLLRSLELVPASRERVVPTEWQARTVLGDSQRLPGACPSKSTRGSIIGHELDQGPT